ncbi:S-adenosyl-L-methionine-dependent methyltransferase, partial [Thamnocephalis sphaerospora]
YDSADYWEQRFQTERQFEWLLDFEQLRPILLDLPAENASAAFGPNALIRANDRILHIGCGSSRLGIDLAHAGCTHVVNTDLSASAISNGRQRAEEERQRGSSILDWIQADALDMREVFADASMDVVLDKSLLDAISCGDSDMAAVAARLAEEVGRVLKPGGCWIIISYSSSR